MSISLGATTAATPNLDASVQDLAVAAIRSGLTPETNPDSQLCQVIRHTTASPNASDDTTANTSTLTNKRKVVASFNLKQAPRASTKPKDDLVRKFFIITLLEDGKLVHSLCY